MHGYENTAFGVLLGAFMSSLFLLELLNIFRQEKHFCCVGTIMVTVGLLFLLRRLPCMWKSECGVGVGLVSGAAAPLLSLLF